MDHPAIAVFTRKSRAHILADGGSGSWVLNLRHAQKFPFVVCVRNGRGSDLYADEPHGTAFLVGRALGVQRLADQNGMARWRLTFSEWAPLDVADVWKGWRNPVRYTTLRALGISLNEVHFQPMPIRGDAPAFDTKQQAPLTIAQAKAGLAATFDVSPDSIEITIRG